MSEALLRRRGENLSLVIELVSCWLRYNSLVRFRFSSVYSRAGFLFSPSAIITTFASSLSFRRDGHRLGKQHVVFCCSAFGFSLDHRSVFSVGVLVCRSAGDGVISNLIVLTCVSPCPFIDNRLHQNVCCWVRVPRGDS